MREPLASRRVLASARMVHGSLLPMPPSDRHVSIALRNRGLSRFHPWYTTATDTAIQTANTRITKVEEQLDQNHKGKLEPVELVPIIVSFMPPNAPPLTEEQCLAFTEMFDRNGDKVIDRLEFFYLVEFIIVHHMIKFQEQQKQVAAWMMQRAMWRECPCLVWSV